MIIRLLNFLLIGSIVSSLLLSSCEKDENGILDNPDYSQDQGEFKDSRDGKTYKWVKIDDQIWMAENLTYTGGGQYITDNDEWVNNTDYDGWCYYDNESNNGTTYGLLYQWEAAKIACPSGWHLPNDTEWTKLEQFIDNNGHSGNVGSSLKALTGWNDGGSGTDDYGYSALPGGFRSNINGTFHGVGGDCYWWCSTEYNSNYVYASFLFYFDADIHLHYDDKSYGFSVRCLRD